MRVFSSETSTHASLRRRSTGKAEAVLAGGVRPPRPAV
jgi:hypothetical protein